MKLHVLCDCDENKKITGQMDGEMIWQHTIPKRYINTKLFNVDPNEKEKAMAQWRKEEAYEANSQ